MKLFGELSNSQKMETFKNALELARNFIDGEIGYSPTYSGPLDEESQEIIDYLKEYNKRGILTDNSQPWVNNDDGVQTPFVEGFCSWEMHDLMCKNADSRGYVYATLQMQTYKTKYSNPKTWVINLSASHEGENCQISLSNPTYAPFLIRHGKFALDSWEITLSETPLYYFIFSETSLPLSRSQIKPGNNLFFSNLIKIPEVSFLEKFKN